MNGSRYYYNLWNLFSNPDMIASNPYGNSIYFQLDGIWRVYNAETGEIVRTEESAIGLCAWLNEWEYQPTGKCKAA